MKLTNTAVKQAKPGDVIRKMADGNGLILVIHPNGSKYWRYKYRHLGKEKSLSLGIYPEVGLAEAREKLAEVRKQVSGGKDPSEARKATKRLAVIAAENNFEAVAREWMDNQRNKWTPRYADFMTKRLEADIFPKLGARPVAEIDAPELLTVIRAIEKRGALEIAQRALQACGQVFMFAIVTGRAQRNPAADLKGALKTPTKKHHAHLEAVELPELLQKLDAYDGALQTKLALRFLLLTFVRTTELRGAEWTEIDLEKAEWRIPAERMKMRLGHIVPLSRQAVTILKELKLLNGRWKYVFPNSVKPVKCMSENTMLYALYRMGYHGRTTGHGFRHTASTILNEHGFHRDHIERQLAHVERNKVRGVYNHAEYLPQRREMMQWWADYLDGVASLDSASQAVTVKGS